jgi:hypothetical protein
LKSCVYWWRLPAPKEGNYIRLNNTLNILADN